MSSVNNKILWGVLAIVAVFGVVRVASARVDFFTLLAERTAPLLADSLSGAALGEGLLGGSFTTGPTNLTASDDWQAVNSLFEYGDLEVDGTTYLDGALFVEGDANVSSFVQGGAVANLSGSASTTLTAAQICDNSTWVIGSTGADIITYTFPATTTLFTDCLLADGDSKELVVFNATATSSVFAAGGSSLGVSASTTIGAAEYALLKVQRTVSGAYSVLITNIAN